jgi:transposase-like protein
MQLSNNQTDEMAELVATGRDGRVHYTREQRERVLGLFEKSGMSGKAFAEKYGIKYPTFALWRRQQREKPDGDTGGFVLAEIAGEDCPAGHLTLVLPGGSEVRASGECGVDLMASLIRKLSAPC